MSLIVQKYGGTSMGSPERIREVAQGHIPFYEKNLEEVIRRNVRAGRLLYSTDLASASQRAQVIFLAEDDCTGIEGIPAEEAEAMIAALADHIVKPAFVYRHQWRRGDLLMWDNCTVQHRAIQDYDMPQRRLMNRTTMDGAAPI